MPRFLCKPFGTSVRCVKGKMAFALVLIVLGNAYFATLNV